MSILPINLMVTFGIQTVVNRNHSIKGSLKPKIIFLTEVFCRYLDYMKDLNEKTYIIYNGYVSYPLWK